MELARDVCQEALLVVLERLRTVGLSDPAGLEAFVAQTARYLASADFRKKKRQRTETAVDTLDTVLDPHPQPSDNAESSRLTSLVQRLLDQLPGERDRSVLIRFYLREEDKTVICRDLNLTDLGLNQVLFRARSRLRQLMIEAGYEKRDFLDNEGTQ